MANEDEKELDTLDLGFADLSTIDANILARAVVKLKNVNLSLTKLSPRQVETVFSVLDKEKNAELHTLGLSRRSSVNLSTVDPGVLSRVIMRLKNADLIKLAKLTNYPNTKLSPHQVEKMFALLDKETNTESNKLRLVDPDVLARLVVRLKNVKCTMYNCCP